MGCQRPVKDASIPGGLEHIGGAMNYWFVPLIGVLALIIVLGHGSAPRWIVILLSVIFVIGAAIFLGTFGLSGIVQTVCNLSGICPKT